MMPAISSAPMLSPARLPSSTPREDGGISMARPPVPMMGPMDMCGAYPRRVISGIISEPSMAVLAMVDPVSVEKVEPPATVM